MNIKDIRIRVMEREDYYRGTETAYLLSIIEQAETDLEQTKQYLEAEAYTNAWKETIKALKSIQGDE